MEVGTGKFGEVLKYAEFNFGGNPPRLTNVDACFSKMDPRAPDWHLESNKVHEHYLLGLTWPWSDIPRDVREVKRVVRCTSCKKCAGSGSCRELWRGRFSLEENPADLLLFVKLKDIGLPTNNLYSWVIKGSFHFTIWLEFQLFCKVC